MEIELECLDDIEDDRRCHGNHGFRKFTLRVFENCGYHGNAGEYFKINSLTYFFVYVLAQGLGYFEQDLPGNHLLTASRVS